MIDLNKPQKELEKDLEKLSPGHPEYELILSKIYRIQQDTNNIQTAFLIDEIKILRKTMIDLDRSNKNFSFILGLFALIQITIAGLQFVLEVSNSSNKRLAIFVSVGFFVIMILVIKKIHKITKEK